MTSEELPSGDRSGRDTDGPNRRSAVRDSGALALGSLVSGLAAYAFIAIGTRSIGSNQFAPVSVLWTLWAMSAAVFTFPIQHWVIRTVEADGGEGRVQKALLTFTAAATAVGALMGLLSGLFRATLFGTEGWLFPALTAAIPVGSVLTGLNRGVLAARRRFHSTAAAIAGENLIRAVAAVFSATSGTFGLCLIAGFGIVLLWPSSFRLGRGGSTEAQLSPLAFVGGVAGGSLVGQLVLTSGPVFVAVIGGTPAEVTGLFSALALFRAPYMIAIGVSPRLTAWLTRLALDEDRAALRRVTLRIVAFGVLLALAAGGVAGLIGPDILRLVFGPDVTLSSTATGVVAAASTLALCSLFLTLMMVASARVATVSAVWAMAALAGGALLAVGPGAPVDTVAMAFLGAETVAVAAIAWVFLSPRSRVAPRRST